MTGRSYRVRGVVQGVGFRWWTRRQGDGLGLVGTVRNEPDGSVVVTAWGAEGAMAELERRLWQGPAGARVAGVDVIATPPGPAPSDFTIER